MKELVPLKDLVNITNGFAFKSSKYTSSGVRIIRITNVQKGKIVDDDPKFYLLETLNNFNTFRLDENDILMSLTGNVGRVGLFPKELMPAFVNQRVCRIKPVVKNIFYKYLFYILNSNQFEFDALKNSSGIAQLNLSTRWIENYKISVPPLETQRKIAAILDKADELRQNDKKILEKYDQLARSVFLEMFGDIDSNLKYKIISIGDVVTEVKDGPHVSPSYATEGIPILSIRNIRPFELDLSDMKYVSEGTFKELTKRFKPQRNDILLTKGGTTGYAKLVNWDWEFCIWLHIAALRPDLELINPRYLEVALNSYFCYRQSQKYTHGIANKDLGLKRLINIKFPLPPMKYQDKFSKIFDRINHQKELSKQSLQKSEELFQSLLQRAFKGELV